MQKMMIDSPNNSLTIPENTATLKTLPTEELRAELGRMLTLTARALIYLAAIWTELEERGEDLSDLRSGLTAYLPLIAEGKIDPDIVVRYAGQKVLLGTLSNLPIEQQRSLLETGTVDIVTLNDTGQRQIVTKPLPRLSATEVRHVFSTDGIRSPDEQFALLVQGRRKTNTAKGIAGRAAGIPRRARKVVLNREDKSVTIGNASVTIDRLTEILSDFYGTNLEEKLSR